MAGLSRDHAPTLMRRGLDRMPIIRKDVAVKVKVKQFAVDMEVKTSGIELEVRKPDDSAQIGDCYVTKTGLTWCKGKTTRAKGIQITWSEVAELLASKKAKDEALKAARST